MADGGYGVGLFDSKGPQNFADAIGKISTALTGVESSFSSFGAKAAASIGNISKAIDELVAKLKNVQMPSMTTPGAPGGAPGAPGGGAPGWQTPTAPGDIPRAPQWASRGATILQPGGTNAPGPNTMPGNQGSAEQAIANDLSDSTFMKMNERTAADVKPASQTNAGNGGGGGPSWSWGRAAQSMGAAAAGQAMNYLGGANGMIATSVQGATIGQLISGQSFMSGAARRNYVIPQGQLVQNVGDYAQGNYYASMMMGTNANAPAGSLSAQNFSTLQKSANQLMTLVPGMSYQGSMAAMNQMQQAGTLNAALRVGIQLRPGGRMQDITQNYSAIFARMFPGGSPSEDVFDQVMAPGGTGQSNLASIGIAPGTDAYYGFMQYARTRLKMQSQNKDINKIDLGSQKGAKQAGLDTPYYSQLKAQSKKSQLESKAEPTIADAAKTLNDAATKLLNYAEDMTNMGGGIGKMFGLHGLMGSGGLMGMLNPMSMVGHIPGLGGLLKGIPGLGTLVGGGGGIGGLAGKIPGVGGLAKGMLGLAGFQHGGPVHGTDSVPAMLTPGEYVIPQKIVEALSKSMPGQTLQQMLHAGGGLTGGQQTGSSTVAQLMSSTLNNLQPNSVASILFSPPGAGTVLARFTAAKGGGGGGGGGAGGGGTGVGGGTGGPQQGGGGVPSGTASTPGPSTGPYSWQYKGGGTTAAVQDLSGIFSTGSTSDSSQTSSSGTSGGSGGTGGGASTLTGSGNVQQAYNFFLTKGLKDFMSAGIVGNLAQESGVSPTSTSPGAFGVAQWTPPDALYAWAKQQNRDKSSLATQLDFLWYQLQTNEKGALSMVQSSTDASSAAQAFEQGYERAGIPMMQNRIKYAQNVLASKGANYARGSQLIQHTGLAMLHAGEAVVPAADNYSAGGTYNRNGAMGGGGGAGIVLNFKAGSIVLQVPPTSSQRDMETMATQFVQAIAKPTILAAVRST